MPTLPARLHVLARAHVEPHCEWDDFARPRLEPSCARDAFTREPVEAAGSLEARFRRAAKPLAASSHAKSADTCHRVPPRTRRGCEPPFRRSAFQTSTRATRL